MEISEEQRKQLLSYMWKRPYGEVAQLIAMLVSLKPIKNNSVTSKSKWVQRLNYIKNLLKSGVNFRLLGLKTLAYLVLLTCWSVIITGTFLQ